VSVAAKKKPGVIQATLDLNTGHLELDLEPGNRLTVQDFREGVRRNGFKPKEAEITAVGTVEGEGDTVLLAITGTSMQPRLVGPAPLLDEAHKHKRVRVIGKLSETDETLTLIAVEPVSSGN
jgi:hypothetical protein